MSAHSRDEAVALRDAVAQLPAAEIASLYAATDRSQAVIEYALDGTVLRANRNFLAAMGYTLREIQGQHHSLFCSPEYTQSTEYRVFWLRLNEGEFISGRFQRVGKYNTRGVDPGHLQPDLRPQRQGLEDHQVRLRRDPRGAAGAPHRRQERGDARQHRPAGGQHHRDHRQLRHRRRERRCRQHGVGFSVVAGEVRKLAERSSTAAREIAKLIDETVMQVGQGAEVSREAAHSFEGVLRAVERTDGSVGQIARAAETQRLSAQAVSSLIAELTVPSSGPRAQ